MLPSSMRGFAPEINGIAQSNARITVSQNGNVVYQTYVAPGPFSIKDLYPTGSSGTYRSISVKKMVLKEPLFIPILHYP